MGNIERFSRSGKLGYKNERGEIVIQPQFDKGCLFLKHSDDSERGFSYGSVMSKGRCGVVREDGQIVVPIEYEEAWHLFDDLFAVRKSMPGRSWVMGVINADGEIVVPFDYEYISCLSPFIQCFKKADSKYIYSVGNMDVYGRVFVYTPKSGECWFNKEGVLIFEGEGIRAKCGSLVTVVNDKYGAIDLNGNPILPNKYDDLYCASENLFVVRQNDGDSWSFGVIDRDGNTVIPFDFKYIESSNPSFFECNLDCECGIEDGGYNYEKRTYELYRRGIYKYTSRKEIHWYSSQGVFLHDGCGDILNNSLLAVAKGGKWGVYNSDAKRIVNFSYDTIHGLGDKILVIKDSCIGILNADGSVLIPPSFKSIECVCIDDVVFEWGKKDKTYGKFSREYPFSTLDCGPCLDRAEIRYERDERHLGFNLSNPRPERFDFNNTFILRTDSYEEIFSVDEGVFSKSRYDKISQLTNLSFAVKKGEKWGVFRTDINDLVIPCEYDEITFEGNHVVLLRKGRSWGAKTLVLPDHVLYPFMQADIPTQYLEIKTLNHPQETLFGVKLVDKDLADKPTERYTILGFDGQEIDGMWRFYDIDSQFTYYRHDRILCSSNGRFGFISLDGYETIPFKYDEVNHLNDDVFSVRIGSSWGLLSLDKGEFVAIKYNRPIGLNFKDSLVIDAVTRGLGILSESGAERVPAIYEHLIKNGDYTFFGYGGYEDRDYPTFFSSIVDATWGCLDINGKVIIPCKYDCLEIRGEYILAGRDGGMLGRDGSNYSSDYSGVFDLYDKSGTLIIGGFRTFEFVEEQKLYKFFFGGTWRHTRELIDEWNGIYHNSYCFDETNGRWVITDMELKSIKLTADSKEYSFKKGHIVTIRSETKDKKTTHYWNCSVDVLFKSCPSFAGDYLICCAGKKSNLIRIIDGKESQYYDDIQYIGKDLFFVNQEGRVGILNFDGDVILPINYVALTKPVNLFVFAVRELEDGFCCVDLIDISSRECKEYRAISRAKLSDVLNLMALGLFLIYSNNEEDGLKTISVCSRAKFDKEFQDMISLYEEGEFLKKFSVCYWFSNHRDLRPRNVSIDYGRGDDNDYMRDSWDAMTDGMYGDMPDGFDGDYGFLGRD